MMRNFPTFYHGFKVSFGGWDAIKRFNSSPFQWDELLFLSVLILFWGGDYICNVDIIIYIIYIIYNYMYTIINIYIYVYI